MHSRENIHVNSDDDWPLQTGLHVPVVRNLEKLLIFFII